MAGLIWLWNQPSVAANAATVVRGKPQATPPRPPSRITLRLAQTASLSHTVDAVISEDTQDLFFDAPAQGKKQSPRAVAKPQIYQPPVTAVQTFARTHTVDAVVSEDVQDLFFNAPLRAPRVQVPLVVGKPRVEGRLPSQTTSSRSHSVDAVVSEDVQDLFFNRPAQGRTQAPRIVGRPRITQPPSTTINARTHQVDAVITKNFTSSFTVDAIVSADTQDLFFNRPFKGIPRSQTLPRYLGSRVPFSPAITTSLRTHTVTAVVQAPNNLRSHAVTAVIFKTIPLTYTADAEIGQPYQTRTFQVTAFIYNPFPQWPQDDGVQWPQDGDNEPQWPQTGSNNPAWPGGSGSQWPQDNESGGW